MDRHSARRTMRAGVVLGVGLAVWFSSIAWHAARVRAFRSECAAFRAPDHTVVYTADPALRTYLLGSPGYSAYGDAAHRDTPVCYRRYASAAGDHPLTTVLFLGKLQAANGVEQVWAIGTDGTNLIGSLLNPRDDFDRGLFESDGPARPRWNFGTTLPLDAGMTVYFGQKDPADPSRFVAQFRSAPGPGEIVGRLTPSGDLELNVRYLDAKPPGG